MATPKPKRGPASPHGTQAWLAVVRAYNLCDVVMSARLAELGVRVAEHEVLATMASAPGLTQQALAARCFVAKSGVSMLLTQMQERGLVLRESDAADARVKRLYLTPAGQALAAQTLQVQAEVVAAMVQGATEAEFATVLEVMSRASTQLEAMRDALGAAQRGG
jgi:DNA-binding MarR family transcriptional regulator